ncbi:MAG: hypothetical protein DRQ40_09575 [Gammaproteobacteria bacterium]|nr:MAG: hypothetical protein DRQ40_09575 [Gammaproteobacteria bacterium]
MSIVVDFTTGQPKQRESVWCQFDGTIASLTNNVVIDTLPLNEFDRMKYEISFKGTTQDDVRSLSMNVQQLDGSIKEQVYGRLGPMKISLDTNINGASFELLASNPENFDVNFCLTVLTT